MGLAVTILALVAPAIRIRINTTTVKFAVAEIAFVVAAIREREDTSTIFFTVSELALVALVWLSVHEPMEDTVTLSSSVRTCAGPTDRRIWVRLWVLIPDPTSGPGVRDPARLRGLRGHGTREQDQREQ